MERKYCPDCQQRVPLDWFTLDKARPDGRNYYCRYCHERRKKRYRAQETAEQRARRLAIAKDYREAHTEKMRAYLKAYYAENGDRWRERRDARYDEYHAYRKNYNTMRMRNLKQRTFPEQKRAIVEFYKNCPQGYHVDHIVPVTHPLVSGLHVLANLQYLRASENSRKRNKFKET